MTEHDYLNSLWRGALRIVLIYALFGAAWILCSDQLLALLVREPGQMTRLSMFKGWFYVAVTSLLLLVLLRGYVQHIMRERAERRRAEGLLRLIADSSDDAIFAKDLEGRYLLFNPAAGRIVGRPPAEVLGRDDRAIFPPAQAGMLMETGRRVMERGEIETNEERLDTAAGPRTFLATKGPLRDADGNILGTFGISRDISERKTAHETLQTQRDLIQHYLDTMQTLVVALDRDGCITMINRAGCEMLGYGAEELLGRSWFDTCLPQPEGRERTYPIFQAIIGGRIDELASVDNAILCRDGSRRLIAWHNSILRDATGQVIGTLSSGQDITERKAVEEALRAQVEELERFNRASIGRELTMIELKQQVNALERELGRTPPWPGAEQLTLSPEAAGEEERRP